MILTPQPLEPCALGAFLHCIIRNAMTNHDWAANAAICAVSRANALQWGTPRQQREFNTFQDLIAIDWRWNEHPPALGGRPQ